MFNFWISSTKKKHWVFERDFKKQEFLVLEKFSLKYSRAYKILFKRLEYFKNIFFCFLNPRTFKQIVVQIQRFKHF